MNNDSNYRFLGVGHPRTGTGYTSKLLSALGYSVGHEKLNKDGIVAWQMTLPLEKHGKELPWVHPKIDYNNLNFDLIIYNTRNPKDSIPSIVFTENTSLIHRSKFIDFSVCENDVERAILSIIKFDEQIKKQYPKHIQYRVEDQQEKIINHINNMFGVINDYKLPNKNYNTRKSRYEDKIIDYSIVRQEYRKMINKFCTQYGYEKIY